MATFIYLLSCLLRPVSISGCTSSESSYIWLAIKSVLPPLDAWLVRLMEEAICGGVKTWQPVSILSNERQAIKRQAAQNGCMYARPAALRFRPCWCDVWQFSLGASRALTTSAKFSSGQRWPPARRVTIPCPLGGTSFRLCVEGVGGGGAYTIRGTLGGLESWEIWPPSQSRSETTKRECLRRGSSGRRAQRQRHGQGQSS